MAHVAALVVAAALGVGAVGCSSREQAPAARPPGASSTPTPAAAPDAAAPAPAATRVGVGHVAGRLGVRSRERVKAAVTRVVDGYLDGAFTAGPWPREDFTAAFADFRRGAAEDATTRDLDLLTLHAVGASLGEVQARERRLRIDVLAPDGQARAATALVSLELATTPADPGAVPGAVPASVRVEGSLFLTRERGRWKVFGYDLRQERA